jgi:hypothetical protein
MAEVIIRVVNWEEEYSTQHGQTAESQGNTVRTPGHGVGSQILAFQNR